MKMKHCLPLALKIIVVASVPFGLDSHNNDTNHERKTAKRISKEWWQHATIYQIYPRSFADSDGDGVGDLRGITKKLNHLNDIGVDTVWMSPIFKSPQKDFGYDVSDFYAIHEEYGSMDDFEKFMAKATELKIKVLLDFVPNHSSDQCEWFKKSINGDLKYKDYYVWRSGYFDLILNKTIPPNNWISVFGGSAWTWNPKRKQYYLHQFLPSQPDLNYRNVHVVEEMENVLKFWLKKGVSGFRVDAINHLFEDDRLIDEPRNDHVSDPNSYEYLEHIFTKDLSETYDMIYEWRKLLDKWSHENSNNYYDKCLNDASKILVTEAYTSTENTMRYYESADGQPGAHMPFNFQLIYIPKEATAQRIKQHIDLWLDNMPQGHTANWVIGSHDHSRVSSRLSTQLLPIMHTINQMLPGSSYTYYGDEIGMTDNRNFKPMDSRDPNRTPMQWNNETSSGFSTSNNTWLPINKNYKTINVATLKELPRSNYHYFKELTRLRNEPTIINGDVTIKSLNRHLLVFIREYDDYPTYVILLNLSSEKQQITLESFANLYGKQLTIVASAPLSDYRIDNKVYALNVTIRSFDALILRADATQ